MSRPKDDRRIPIPSVTTDDLAHRISGALRREFGDWSCAVKRIASAMQPPAHPRAVRNWWDAKNPPNAAQLMRLSQVSAQVRLELLTIMSQRQSLNDLVIQEAKERDEAIALATDRIGNTGMAHPAPGGPPRSDHEDN